MAKLESADKFSPEVRAGLLARAREQALKGEKARRIDRRPTGAPVPLSYGQERLWFLNRLEPQSSAYNIPLVLHITGAVDSLAIEQSLKAVIDRHEAMRTTFKANDGVPFQVIAETLDWRLSQFDLIDCPKDERLIQAEKFIQAQASSVFDLSEGPLVKAALLRLSATTYVLSITMHHIMSDGWSFRILIHELAALYNAFINGTTAELETVPVQYGDFAHWQRSCLSDEALKPSFSYWRDRLKGDIPPLQLPTDRPRSLSPSGRGSRYRFELSKESAGALQAFGNRLRVTSFVTLLAAFSTWLSRYSGQRDVIVGSPIAGRSRSEIENTVGFFANTVVFRTDLSGDPTFTQLAARVQDAALGVYAHEDMPFEKLVDGVLVGRDLTRNPLFQIMFVYQNDRGSQLALGGGTKVSIWDVDNGTSKFDVTLNIWSQDDRVGGHLEYSTDLFDQLTIQRWIRHFEVLLGNLISHADRPISTARLLTEEERSQAIVVWNSTAVPSPDKCLHELFEHHSSTAPDSIAVIYLDEHFTYAQINTSANRLARFLESLGAGPDAAVGVCLERSPRWLIGLMGVAKAGAAYLPLDPAYPPDRLSFMVNDAGLRIVVTETNAGCNIQCSSCKVVLIDSEWERIASQRAENVLTEVTPDNLAYVIYTSGSTGTPKGVMLNHRGRVNNFTDFNERLGIGPADRLLAVSSLSFDMSAYDVFGTLACGATIVLPEAANATDASRWLQLMQEQEVTVWHSVPALLQMLVESADARRIKLDALRWVLLGGDWIPISLPDRLRKVSNHARVISLGGATEASMDSIIYPIDSIDPLWKTIPYGRPMRNQRTYVVAAEGEPAAVGIAGELFLGGLGLAYGYFRRPDLTAERFVPDPFSVVPGERMYETGDVARYFRDGNIELLGRQDHQVKIRGCRIELEEVAAALKLYDGIRDALVVARGDHNDKYLTAYFVADASHTLAADNLRGFMQECLPEYMVPSAFVRLDKIPLTPNGKIDRRALPAPELCPSERKKNYVPPRTSVEKVLAGVWMDVLNLDRVGIDDNFFELRGHSLLATRVISRIYDWFQVDLPIRALFSSPTIGQLSEQVVKTCTSAGLDASQIAEAVLDVAEMSGEQLKASLALHHNTES